MNTVIAVDGRECTVKSTGEPGGVTLDEAWEVEWPEDDPHPYVASAFFALRGLGVCSRFMTYCLTVGSTVFEARMLRGHRWDVTMLDVRKPSVDDVQFVLGDATDIPFNDGVFSALSSTCCLCHVGLGRYGDKVMERGDRVAMGEFARVLVKGGKASIMFGPCIPVLKQTMTMGTVHRVYALKDVEDMVHEAGFLIDTAGLWCSAKRRWLAPDEVAERKNQKMEVGAELVYCYLSMLLEKR